MAYFDEDEENESTIPATAPDVNQADIARLDQEFADSDDMQSEVVDPFEPLDIPEEPQKPITAAEILANYRKLKGAQDSQAEQMRNIGMLGGANVIAKGFAMGQGAKIDDNDAGIKRLTAQAQQPVKDIQNTLDLASNSIGAQSKAMQLEEAEKMADPGSDISKYYREQAYALLKKIAPDTDYSGKLDNMSASQLQKLPGMKNMGQMPRADWIATDRVDSKGNPIRFNKMTGEYSLANGQTISPGDYTARDILRKDELTGQYGIGNAQGMRVLPTNYSGTMASPGAQNEAKEKTYTQADITKAGPKLGDELGKLQKSYRDEMKESREVASSITNLANKLAGGDAKGVDSGLLGGIQTQAAKMAGQKGVLTDQDLVKFAGAGGWKAASERAIQNAATGKMTKADLDFFKTFADKMGRSLDEDIANRTQIYSRQGQGLLETIAPGITEANVNKLLGADVVAPAVQGGKNVNKTMVRIKTPSGKLMDIPKEKLKDALKKGATEVKK